MSTTAFTREDSLTHLLRPGRHFSARIVADGSNHDEWMRARARGITATDVAKLSTRRSIETVATEKLYGSSFAGNSYTEHGKLREPVIAEWVEREYGISASSALFHAPRDMRHLATPDGLTERAGGALELAEIKTSTKSLEAIPRNYMRQIWWQQYVLGAERTLFVWEEHRDFVPVGNPQARWVYRDETEIKKLLTMASELIDLLIERTSR